MRRGAHALGAAALVSVLLAAPAAAQDPYGPTSTSVLSNTIVPVTCELSVTSGDTGASVTATVRSAPAGDDVRVLFGGTAVGQAAAPGGASPLAIPFVVPSVAPGSYLVTAVGVGFTAVCSPASGGRFEVLADAISRDGGGSGGALPRTGIYVLLLLAVAAALVLLGRALMEESRRRRRKEEWDLRAEAAGVTSEAK